jgi:hypothetical protein
MWKKKNSIQYYHRYKDSNRLKENMTLMNWPAGAYITMMTPWGAFILQLAAIKIWVRLEMFR